MIVKVTVHWFSMIESIVVGPNIWYWSCIGICMYIVYELVVQVGSTSTVRVPVPVIIPVPVL